MKTKITVILTALLIMSAQCSATEIVGTVTAGYTGLGASDTMTIWGGGFSNYSTPTGAILLNKTAGTGDGQYIDNGTVGVFCIDLFETVKSGSLAYNVIMTEDGPVTSASYLSGGMGEVKAAYIAELWTKHYDTAWTSGSYTTGQKAAAEAFQAAIWEIVYEDLPSSPVYWDVAVDSTLGDGGFKATNLNSTLANSWLHSLNGTGSAVELRALTYNGSQDFITAFNIPEPATVALVSMGLLFLVGRKRN
ncbi:MAG: PEP-CTERM sorting domain-containing protein [Planctomycetaceae bacterium]|nr:PEP-CTERM sorting domain-containing protein [Planctomycetaceae bacterium]